MPKHEDELPDLLVESAKAIIGIRGEIKKLNQEIHEWEDSASFLEERQGALHVADTVTKRRRLARRYLRSKFGFKVVSDPVVTDPCGSITRGIRADRDRSVFALAWVEWLFWNRPITVADRMASEWEPWHQIIRQELDCQYKNPYPIYAFAASALKDRVMKTTVLYALIPLIRERLNFTLNSRLRSAVEQQGGDREANLLRQLPGAIVLAWDELERSFDPDAFVRNPKALINRTAQLLEVERQKDVQLSTVDPTVADFILRAQAQAQGRRWFPSANLSPNESEVLALGIRGYKQKEIAAMLDVQVGTVKSLKYRAQAKLRRLEGQ